MIITKYIAILGSCKHFWREKTHVTIRVYANSLNKVNIPNFKLVHSLFQFFSQTSENLVMTAMTKKVFEHLIIILILFWRYFFFVEKIHGIPYLPVSYHFSEWWSFLNNGHHMLLRKELYFGQFTYRTLWKFVCNDWIESCCISMKGESCIHRAQHSVRKCT